MDDLRKPTTIRLSDAEKATIAQAAKASGEGIAAWMRRILLAAAKKVK